MAKVTIIHDTSRKRKKGSPVFLILNHNHETIRISTKIIIDSKYWDDRRKKIKAGCKEFKNVSRVNNHLTVMRAELISFIEDLNTKHELNLLSAKDIINKFNNRFVVTDFFEYAKKITQDLFDAGKIGTAQSYLNATNFLKTIGNKKPLKFSDLNYSFLVRIENKYVAEGKSLNGLAVHLRSIRAIYNKAIKEGVCQKELYPFDKYKIKQEKTKKRALTLDEIKRIENLEIPENTTLFHLQQIFMFSFYTIGMNLVDILKLKISDLQDGRINYVRSKTYKKFSIKITGKIEQILNYYTDNKKDNDLVFPLMPNKKLSKQEYFNEYKKVRDNLNRRIKTLAKMAEISKLTFYSARHSWASLANTKKIPITAISQSLGHADIKTTQIYLKSLDNEIIDGYNEEITNFD